MAEELERFGKYLILDHLVDGGMAKICRARFLGEQASKIVAIKMVQPQYSKDPNFKSMFEDEVKVTFGLLHPNIVQTYDYGVTNDQLFVAMEYCDGRNLKEFNDKLLKQKNVFPVPIIIYIITEVCKGLNYAHSLTDKLSGKKLGIIHRDISPHNIMLTYDGAIKVIDFGIAKSETNQDATQAGTIKGKLSYLAPEYLEGMTLDPRYDQFAVGITMWEMLCGRKLFKAANDLAILKKIQECKIPAPSSINPHVTPELDKIVLKALSKDRNKRYKDMIDFNKELIKYLYSTFPEFNSADLSYFASSLFQEEIKKDREKLFKYGKIDVRPYLEALRLENEGGSAAAANPSKAGGQAALPASDMPTQTGVKKEQVLDFGFEEGDATVPRRRLSKIEKEEPKPEGTAPKVDLSKKFGDRIDNEKLKIERVKPKKVKDKTEVRGKTRSGKKKKGKKSLDNSGTETGTETIMLRSLKNKNRKKVIVVAVACLVAAVYFGQAEIMKIIKPQKDVVVEGPIKTKDPVIEVPKLVKLTFKNIDKYNDRVFINGEETEMALFNEIEIEKGRDITIRIVKPGRRYFVKPLTVRGPASIEVPELADEVFGYLGNSRNCVVGKLFFKLYGEKRVQELPLSNRIKFPTASDDKGNPAPKTYEVFVQRSGKKIQRKLKFTIEREDHVVDICEKI
ncbi:MAG: serine/threonine protein kinase [Halobacteriovoraceae bacterium]|jgi:eukaryotic-like serine/threonine-protein kinase|nr:serine/threonine protein kinase [Halobacteriovoraceae bacterium]MBT5094624.1 serine/threonine protein kinase [Halobacteriovoraceae bacterium]